MGLTDATSGRDRKRTIGTLLLILDEQKKMNELLERLVTAVERGADERSTSTF